MIKAIELFLGIIFYVAIGTMLLFIAYCIALFIRFLINNFKGGEG